MIKVFDKIFDHLQHGPQRKKVEQYLHNTTPVSLLGDLRKQLAQRFPAINGLWTTFEACCFQGPSEEDQCWTQESFRNHIQKVHPNTVFPDAVVDLLWTCFYFYAYHPFPRRDVAAGKVQWPSFQPSFSLLAFRGTELLGTLEDGDYSWRFDESFTSRANFNRILRSISHPEETPGNQQPSQDAVDDAMDVLAMTQPQDISLSPSPDMLKPAAQKLISGSATQSQFRINRDELSPLLSLLLRLRRYGAKWTRESHYGTFDEPWPQNEELARILTNRLVGQDVVLSSEQIQKGLDTLPNFELCFHQLWATLFQPPMPAYISARKTIQPDPTLDYILRATSLFIPQYTVSNHPQTTKKNTPITFEKLDASSSQGLNNNMGLSHLIKAITHDPSQSNPQRHPQPQSRLLIALGNTTTPGPDPAVVGVFSRGLLWTTEPDDTKEKKRKWGSSHIIFQLRPTFRLLRWTGPHTPLLTDLFCLDDEEVNTGGNEAIALDNGISHKPYWIGGLGTKAGLRIDPGLGTATLRSSGRYEDVGMEGNGNGDGEVTFQFSQVVVFKLEGGGADADDGSGEIVRVKDDPRYGHQEYENRVEGEELAKRIQGFGST